MYDKDEQKFEVIHVLKRHRSLQNVKNKSASPLEVIRCRGQGVWYVVLISVAKDPVSTNKIKWTRCSYHVILTSSRLELLIFCFFSDRRLPYAWYRDENWTLKPHLHPFYALGGGA